MDVIVNWIEKCAKGDKWPKVAICHLMYEIESLDEVVEVCSAEVHITSTYNTAICQFLSARNIKSYNILNTDRRVKPKMYGRLKKMFDRIQKHKHAMCQENYEMYAIFAFMPQYYTQCNIPNLLARFSAFRSFPRFFKMLNLLRKRVFDLKFACASFAIEAVSEEKLMQQVISMSNSATSKAYPDYQEMEDCINFMKFKTTNVRLECLIKYPECILNTLMLNMFRLSHGKESWSVYHDINAINQLCR